MLKINKNQSGFGVVEAILLIVIVGVVGLIGWYVLKQGQKSKNSPETSSQTQTSKETKEANIASINPATGLRFTDTSFSFKDQTKTLAYTVGIPDGWKAVNQETMLEGDNFVHVTDPSGKINLIITAYIPSVPDTSTDSKESPLASFKNTKGETLYLYGYKGTATEQDAYENLTVSSCEQAKCHIKVSNTVDALLTIGSVGSPSNIKIDNALIKDIAAIINTIR